MVQRLTPVPGAAATPPLPDAGSFAFLIEGRQAHPIPPEGAEDAPRAPGSLLWIHLHGPTDACRDWLSVQPHLPPPVRDALVATETRPRCQAMGEGALVNLRGVGDAEIDSADPLVSINLWLERGQVVSVLRRDLHALAPVREAAAAGRIADPGELVARLATAISTELDGTIADVGDRLDELEERLAADENADLRRDTNAIRGQAISFRRFVSPERVALHNLEQLGCDWLDEHDRAELQEAANRFARMTEELDAIRDRAALVSEQLAEARAAVIERRSFVISIVALIFLPLTFFTGLLGINVEGIWYADRPWAFNAVVAICVAVAVLLSAFFFVRRWFGR